MPDDITNAVVIVTGGSQGIGECAAYEFAKAGCNVIITYNQSKEAAEKVTQKCKELGAPSTLVLQLDTQQESSIKNTVDTVIKEYKQIDILVNNAGVVHRKYFADQTIEEIEHQLQTNLTGLIKMTKYCLPYLKKALINVASARGLKGAANVSVYAASKFGVRGFTQGLAEEMPDLLMYVVNPNLTATRMNNFEGTSPEKVGQVIFNAATGKYNLPFGSDINVWEV